MLLEETTKNRAFDTYDKRRLGMGYKVDGSFIGTGASWLLACLVVGAHGEMFSLLLILKESKYLGTGVLCSIDVIRVVYC